MPNDSRIEQAVIGALLLDSTAMDIVNEVLHEECFYATPARYTFNAIQAVYRQNYKVDIFTVLDQLKRDGTLEAVGGVAQMTRFTNNVVSAAHIETHCRILKEKYLLRSFITMGQQLSSSAANPSTDAFDLLHDMEKQLFDISMGNIKSAYKHTGTLGMEAIKRVIHLMQNKEEITGVPTGYTRLNKLTCGWQPTDLILLAARPSVGKTAFALNLALNAAEDVRKPVRVGIFSLEMSASQITDRLLSSMSRIRLEHLRRGRLTEEEQQTLYKTADRLSRLGIFIDDAAAMTTMHIKSTARRMIARDGVGLIVVDYLQLITGSRQKGGSREQEISAISRELKAIAKELEVPVIALSQLSRTIESRASKEPQLSDLRESGSLEQDADIVAFITRDDYQSTEAHGDSNGYIKFRKHRNGALDDIAFKTDLSIQRWFDIPQWDEMQVKHLVKVSEHWQQAVEKDDKPF
jgi:replicative DNA helicase